MHPICACWSLSGHPLLALLVAGPQFAMFRIPSVIDVTKLSKQVLSLISLGSQTEAVLSGEVFVVPDEAVHPDKLYNILTSANIYYPVGDSQDSASAIGHCVECMGEL